MSERHIAFEKIQSLLDTDELASFGPEPRSNREPIKALEDKFRLSFSETKIPEPAQLLTRSLVLLWHDYLDASHSISQDIHSADGSFLHGIMHRREPDYGNAKYWFHRVREHPSFPIIAAKVEKFLNEAKANELNAKLINNSGWDALAFIDACENALHTNDATAINLLKRVQEIEFSTLLEHFCAPSFSSTK